MPSSERKHRNREESRLLSYRGCALAPITHYDAPVRYSLAETAFPPSRSLPSVCYVTSLTLSGSNRIASLLNSLATLHSLDPTLI